MKTLNPSLLKGFVIGVGLLAPFTSVKAQEFVSTSPQNKDVVLEEFTGLNCQYCPQGHKIAQQIKSDNPDDVVLINIHAGGFARPGSDQQDFRTDVGQQLNSYLGVSSYPAATINRTDFGGTTVFGRGEWKSKANQVLQESSPVNVAVRTSIDPANREITAEVEAYYTDSSQAATNKLNVALLENDIPGQQTSGAEYYPANTLQDGQYKHQHMLRHFFTGQWGEAITDPSQGKLVKKTYTYQVPKDYKDVYANLANLEVAAYVAKGRRNVLAGDKAKVTLDQQYLTDMAISDQSSTSGLCDASPKIRVENKGSQEITSFELDFALEEVQTKTINKNIGPGESVTIDLSDQVSLGSGAYNAQIKRIKKINDGNLYDGNIDNHFPDMPSGLAFPEVLVKNEFEADFDAGVDNGVALDQNDNPAFIRTGETVGPSFSSSGVILRVLDRNIQSNSGDPTYLLMGSADLTNLKNPVLTYSYAYSKGDRNVSDLNLKVSYSTDCGSSWTEADQSKLAETSSFSPSRQNPFYTPSLPDDYQTDTFDLSALTDQADAIMRLRFPGTGGSAIAVDEFKVSGEVIDKTGVANSAEAGFEATAYPNPATDQVRLSLALQQQRTISLSVVNSIGQTVKQQELNTYQAGQNRINLNVSDLTPGLYTARLAVGGQIEPVQFIVGK
jgi:thiol-disulfide isomerase/thioredoxin